jgi:tetratricopeptide (TPR) repeat protein
LKAGGEATQRHEFTAMTETERLELAAQYRREDIRRLLQVSERRLRGWEKQGLVDAAGSYGFSDIAALRTIKRLSDLHFTAGQIRKAINGLKTRLEYIERPFEQARFTAEGRRIAVHVAGDKLDPISGQLLFDFDARNGPVRAFPAKRQEQTAAAAVAREAEAEAWFQRGLALEESGAPIQDAVAAYRAAVEANPRASGALVNLGTIAFRMRKLKDAEMLYRRALESDPGYALAHFNLGNLYDEQGNQAEARGHYLEALRLNPRYADTYFNLALLCERNNEILQAIGYWQAYLKLDSTSSWARAAKKQLDRLKRSVRSK